MKKIFIKVMCLAMLLGIVNPQTILANEGEAATPTTYTGDPKEAETGRSSGAITDTVKPVIEGIEFPSNGKEVKVGENVPIYVKAYDADGSIEYVEARIEYRNKDNQYVKDEYIKLQYNADTKRYEGNFIAKNVMDSDAYVSSVKAVDQAGNQVFGVVRDKDYKNIYTFKVLGAIPGDIIEIDTTAIEFEKNGQSLNYNDMLNVGITLPKAITDKYKNITNVNMYFKNGAQSTNFYLENRGQDNPNKFTSYSSLYNYLSSGKYILNQLTFISEGNIETTVTFKDNENVWFTLNDKEDKIKPIITSIDMDKKGEFLNSGDIVTIRIKASDDKALANTNGIIKDAYLYFRPSMDIATNSLSVNLKYDNSTKEFVGELKIPEKIYPCEWYINQINIEDASGNQADTSEFLNLSNPYYFNVKNDNVFVNPTYDVHISANVLDEKGNYVSVNEWEKKNVERRSTLKENGFTFPDAATSYEGLVFKGWVDYNGNPVDENTQIVNNNINSIYAQYDKMVVRSNYRYPKADLTTGYIDECIVVANGSTYKEVLDMMKNKQVDSLYQEGFEKWEVTFSNIRDIDVNSKIKFSPWNYVQASAVYKNKKVVGLSSSYYNVNAMSDYNQKIMLVNNGTTYESVITSLDTKTPELYAGLRFKAWDRSSNSGEIKEDYSSIYQVATYENCLVRFLLTPRLATDNYGVMPTGVGGVDDSFYDIFAVVAEKGETIQIPKFDDYSNIEWLNKTPDNSMVVDNSVSFYGTGDKAGGTEKPENPEKPEIPEIPNKPDDTGATVSNKLPEEKIYKAMNDIKNANAGDVISIDMGSAKTISKEILETAKGKDVVVKLMMGGYLWSINGKDIVASNLEDINLEVKFNTNAIPSNTVKALAGDNPVKQLSLSHNGDFGFKAQLSFNIGTEYNGKYGNLFYYDSDGKMVFMNAGKIDETGEVGVSFSHASEYVIVIKDKIMQDTKEDVLKETGKNNTNVNILNLLILSGAVLLITNNNKKLRKDK